MGRIFVAIVAGAIAFVVAYQLTSNSGEPKKRLDEMSVVEILDKLAATANTMRGQKVSGNVVVIDAVVEGGRFLTYNYKITNVDDEAYSETRAERLAIKLQKKACADRVMSKAIEKGAEINYAYTDKDGDDLFTIDVDRTVCLDLS